MPLDFKNLLLFQTLNKFAKIKFCDSNNCDLYIYGPYFKVSKKNKYCPKFLRKYLISPYPWKRKLKPLTLFYSCENLRWNMYETDFSISSDLGVDDPNHFRLPYWMECLDWTHYDLHDRQNIRYGSLVHINSLTNGIDKKDLKISKNKIIFFASHLKEPRRSLLNNLRKFYTVDCFGPIFNKNIKDHNKSGFFKKDLIKNYKFSFCPENSIYPGYVTEKIIDCLVAGVIPLYQGAPDVTDFIPKDCFIDISEEMDLTKLENRLDQISEVEGIKMIQAGQDFLRSSQAYPFSYQGFARKIAELLKD